MTVQTKHLKLAGLTILVLISGLIYGCTGGSWAYTKHNNSLFETYREKQLPNSMNYYYCGRESLPYAVVGIDPDFTFDSKFWFKIESEEDLYKKIYNLSDLEPHNERMYAKDIVSPSGKVVGIWFSYYNNTAITIDETNGAINVYNPYKPGSKFSGDL